MNLFVIGDVHGCYYTFEKMINTYWNREEELLIQVGDLIDRGNYSPETVAFARTLQEKYPNQVIFLKGNHEYEIILHFVDMFNKHWYRQCGEVTLNQYKRVNRSPEKDVNWFESLPLIWENDRVYVSHAGIAKNAIDPFNEENPLGVLWNREPLKNINKLQIHGHTPLDEPTFDAESNTWNIDTGAAFSGYLTGVKINENGEVKGFYNIKTDSRDKR
ncbi:serine/threonine protein phosphatase 1 [Salirhabdus euzebyi]|uniref:Serine/threonine protein phosphatase 1 n=1 Tax=Salirhabdus euzebyi TaxID=394506 RepID=A0A841Q242_9BACI|nr:metallophosphoesterase family protein [Salirhabdus euzebyi]MBB6452643.1 serine/threonine protein phosphatase 1 [Salirhabdus euzebyi]